MSTGDENKLILHNQMSNYEILDKAIQIKNLPIDSYVSGLLNKIQVTNAPKLNDHSLYKSLNNKIAILNDKIKSLSEKLIWKKSQEISKSMEIIKQSSESQHYLQSIKKYIMEDEDTESSSDDCYSNIEHNSHGISSESSQR